MQRIAIILGIACLAALCSGGLWLASQPPIQAVPPADAADIQVGAGWWEWTLIYRRPRPLEEWYFPVIDQLESAGWTRRETGYAGRPPPLLDPVAYERRISFIFVVFREQVELEGDLHGARVRMRRWIALLKRP